MKDIFTGKSFGTMNGQNYFGTFLGLREQAEKAADQVGGYVENFGLQICHINSEGVITDADKIEGYSVWKTIQINPDYAEPIDPNCFDKDLENWRNNDPESFRKAEEQAKALLLKRLGRE